MNPLETMMVFFYGLLADLKENKRASTALIVGIISLVVILMVGFIVVTRLTDVWSGMSVTGTANTTFYSLVTNVWSSFSLTVIIPIILVAGFILALLMRRWAG